MDKENPNIYVPACCKEERFIPNKNHRVYIPPRVYSNTSIDLSGIINQHQDLSAEAPLARLQGPRKPFSTC